MAEWKRLAQALPHLRKLRQLFNPEFYLAKYPDVAAAGADPFRHYIEYGASEGRKPHPLFDHDYFLLRCPEAKASDEPSVVHFLRQEGASCPNPHPLFDCAAYVRAHASAFERGSNPLLHFVQRRSAPKSDFTDYARNIARFTHMDVQLAIAFVDEERGAKKKPDAGIVWVWEDADGRMQFIAPPEQRPFFEVMKYDQLRSQAR
jgi:hypothetical protein